jgi:glycine/D-amino acid oxidase-like deaminating enzyme
LPSRFLSRKALREQFGIVRAAAVCGYGNLVMETTTGLPMIGAVPGMPHCWVALGYGGNGTTYASIAAGIIAGAINGRPDTDADLYRFSGHARAD